MATVKDPVCGRDVDTEAINRGVGQVIAGAPETDPAAGTKGYHEGSWYYFHSMECRMKFITEPDRFIER